MEKEEIILIEEYISTFELIAYDYIRATQEDNQEDIATARKQYIFAKNAFFAYINQNKNKKIDSKELKSKYESIRNEYYEAVETGQEITEEMKENLKQSKDELDSAVLLKENQKNIKAAAPFIKKIRESKTIEDYIRNTNGKVYTIGNLRERRFIKKAVITLAGAAAITSLSIVMIKGVKNKNIRKIDNKRDIITIESTQQYNSTEKSTSNTQNLQTTEKNEVKESTEELTSTTSEPINYGIFGPDEKQKNANNENSSNNNVDTSSNIPSALNLPAHEEKIEALDPGVDVNATEVSTTVTEYITTEDVTEAPAVSVFTKTIQPSTTEQTDTNSSNLTTEQKNPDGTTTIIEVVSPQKDVEEPEEEEFDFDTISLINRYLNKVSKSYEVSLGQPKKLVMRG